MHLHLLKSAAVFLTALLATAAAVPAPAETADASTSGGNATAHDPTYVVLYNNAAQGAAFRRLPRQYEPGFPGYPHPIRILPGHQSLPDHYIVWKMYKHGNAPGQYTFVNKEMGDNLLYDPNSEDLVTIYSKPAAVFAIEPAGDGEYVIKLPYEDAVAEALVDKDHPRSTVDIDFLPANGSPYQRWTIGKMVGDSDCEWKPWNLKP